MEIVAPRASFNSFRITQWPVIGIVTAFMAWQSTVSMILAVDILGTSINGDDTHLGAVASHIIPMCPNLCTYRSRNLRFPSG